MPLVVVVAALPMACYALSRLGRLLRYYLFAGRAVRSGVGSELFAAQASLDTAERVSMGRT